MSLSQGDSQLPEDPFGTGGGESQEQAGGIADEDKPFNFLNLRSTRPEDALQQVKGQVDFDAKWYEHIAAMLLKQSSGDGVEAWVHGIIAIVILVKENRERSDDPGEAAEEAEYEMNQPAEVDEAYNLDDIFA